MPTPCFPSGRILRHTMGALISQAAVLQRIPCPFCTVSQEIAMRETLNANRPASMAWLGYGGLLPFVGLAVLMAADAPRQALWSQALVAYGAVILGFVGALHWAFAA